MDQTGKEDFERFVSADEKLQNLLPADKAITVVLDLGFALIRDEPLVGALDPFGILLSIIVAFIVGILSMRILLKVARTYNFAIITLVFGLIIVLALIITSII